MEICHGQASTRGSINPHYVSMVGDDQWRSVLAPAPRPRWPPPVWCTGEDGSRCRQIPTSANRHKFISAGGSPTVTTWGTIIVVTTINQPNHPWSKGWTTIAWLIIGSWQMDLHLIVVQLLPFVAWFQQHLLVVCHSNSGIVRSWWNIVIYHGVCMEVKVFDQWNHLYYKQPSQLYVGPLDSKPFNYRHAKFQYILILVY